jgi:hypothetical protein
MHPAVIKMLDLGKINVDNQNDFCDLFSELPTQLTLEEAEALTSIFADDDDDDYSAFVWDMILLIEKTDGIKDSVVVRDSKAYWVQILAYSLERIPNSV